MCVCVCLLATSTRRPYTPPFFGNFGKNTKDLFKKKYEFNNEVKVVGPRTKLGLVSHHNK